MNTAKEILKNTVQTLSAAGIENPEFEAGVLLEDIGGIAPAEIQLSPEKELPTERAAAVAAAAKRRSEGYPLQYIIGSWDFYGRRFACGEGVLIPRAETELLCECVIKYFAKRPAPRIADLCSGTGCIAITLAKEIAGAQVTAVELYDGAMEYLEKNNAAFGGCISAIKGDALVPFGEFDCVVSNPPYVAAAEMPSLQKEVLAEPKAALLGGEDGLDFYRAIAKNWYGHIASGGFIAFEIGETQGRAVEAILKENGYYGVSVWEDYSGLDRIVTAMKH